MKFPVHVYRCPGGTFSPSGVTYNLKAVHSATELDEAVSAGWAMSLDEAAKDITVRDLTPHRRRKKVVVNVAPAPVKDEVPDDDAAPTRQELETKADELGIKYDGRTSDSKLLERISEALDGIHQETIC